MDQVHIHWLALIMLTTPTYSQTCIGRITGGALKTPQEEDKESIQGQWMPIDGLDSIDLRSMDCMNVIKLAESWYAEEQGLKYRHLTIPASCEMTTMRAVVLHRNKYEQYIIYQCHIIHYSGEVNVLLRDVATGNTKLPSCPLTSPSVRHDVERLMNVSRGGWAYINNTVSHYSPLVVLARM